MYLLLVARELHELRHHIVQPAQVRVGVRVGVRARVRVRVRGRVGLGLANPFSDSIFSTL